MQLNQAERNGRSTVRNPALCNFGAKQQSPTVPAYERRGYWVRQRGSPAIRIGAVICVRRFACW
jgi:hypothetical protein